MCLTQILRMIITLILQLMKSGLALIMAFLLPLFYSQCSEYINRNCMFKFAGESCKFDHCSVLKGGLNATQEIYGNWTICLSSCCRPIDPSTPQFLSSIENGCIVNTETENDESVFYAFGFGLGFSLLAIIILYCWGIERLKKFLFRSTEKMELSAIQMNTSTKQQPKPQGVKIMITEQFPHNQFHRRTCCICLFEKTNAKAACGHEYHLSCIQEWYKRKEECPECRTSADGNLTMICNLCSKEKQFNPLFSNKDDECNTCMA